MDYATKNGIPRLPPRRRKQLLHGMVALITVCVLGVALAAAVRQSHIRHQMQTDPEVATVWLMQVTHGPNHTIIRGSTVQRWANEHGVHALGDYQVLTSSFNGTPDGIEFWFDYDSHTSVKELECHRIGPTAFTDDLGQVYHGFLDFQGKTVGVYLPGYDHSAHRITCTVHWMPRRPAAPFPVSRPMAFSVPLAPAHRTLPPASALPDGPVSVTKAGITVTLSDVRLGAPQLRPFYEGQRDLTFQLHVQGGQVADENVDMPIESVGNSGTAPYVQVGGMVTVGSQVRIRQFLSRRTGTGNTVYLSGNGSTPSDTLTITDPYGISLIPATLDVVMPQTNPRKGQPRRPFWTAPVTGAGQGTDCVLFHLHVQPPARSPKSMPPTSVSFDIPIRVSPGAAPVPHS